MTISLLNDIIAPWGGKCMKKIYEKTEIEIWKKLADEVQNLNISDGSDEEFNYNLKLLENIFANLDICVEESIREPQHKNQIGAASLLHAIYSSKQTNHQKKANFYEKVHQLSDIDVQYVSFMPINEYYNMEKFKVRTDSKESAQALHMYYTDGLFSLQTGDEMCRITPKGEWIYYKNYLLENLKDHNYLLEVALEVEREKIEYQAPQMMAIATLKTFDGEFPSKKQISTLSLPKLTVANQSVNWDEPILMKQQLEYFDVSCASYQKRLKIDDHNQYYYTNM